MTAPVPAPQATLRRLLPVAGIILVLGGVSWWWYAGGHETTDNAQIDGHVAPVASRVGGTVQEVKVVDNQAVEAGALLVQVDPRDYEVALSRAKADLADAEAALEAARAGIPITATTTSSEVATATGGVERSGAGVAIAGKDVDAARARLTAAQARLRESQANETRAARDLDRMKQLIAKDEVSQQQYDGAVAAAEAARAAVEAARAMVAEGEQAVSAAESRRSQAVEATRQAEASLRSAGTAPAQVAVIRARAASAEARTAQARAILAQAELNLAYTAIRAPVAGVVSRKTVEVGQVVAPGQPLLAIVPLDTVWVTANFKETQLTDMKPGQKARIRVDTYGRAYDGHVDSIAAATGARFSLLPPENATGNYVKVVQRIPVKIVLDGPRDPERPLRPGMSVTATVFTR
ncbi:MAG: HlyD family secretion protein [Rhodospirillaceae bacterium]